MRAWLFIAVALSGCGSRTDPGTGTRTLLARIDVRGTPSRTQIEAEITARGNPVLGASVRFADRDTDEVFDAEETGRGAYRVRIDGYRRVLQVEIRAEDDGLAAQLEGPAPHVITRPANDVIVRRAGFTTLRVEWEADDRADRVEIEADDTELSIDGDPFEAELPLGGLDDGEQELEVRRETSVELRGGVEGSRMRSRYEVDNRFHLEG